MRRVPDQARAARTAGHHRCATAAHHDLGPSLSRAAQPTVMDAQVLSVVLCSVRIAGRSDQILQRDGDFMRHLEQAHRSWPPREKPAVSLVPRSTASAG